MVKDFLLQTMQREPYRALVLSSLVCQSLLIIEIVICIHYLIVSSPHPVRPTTLPFHLSVNMYVFNLKSHTECHKDKRKESRKQLQDW